MIFDIKKRLSLIVIALGFPIFFIIKNLSMLSEKETLFAKKEIQGVLLQQPLIKLQFLVHLRKDAVVSNQPTNDIDADLKR